MLHINSSSKVLFVSSVTSKMDFALLCKVFFTLGTAVDLGGTLIPPFRQRIMNYGSRSTTANTSAKSTSEAPKDYLASLLDWVASFQVPHTWFTHYYLVSVASSIFWAVQIVTRGKVFLFLASHTPQSTHGSMTINQVVLAWSFMALQGTRRLYESITLTKPSQSKMWVGLWLLGIAYYVFMGISVWIEGIGQCSALIHTMTDLCSFLKFGQFTSESGGNLKTIDEDLYCRSHLYSCFGCAARLP